MILLSLTEVTAQSMDHRLQDLENVVTQLQDALVKARSEIAEFKQAREKDKEDKIEISTTGDGIKFKKDDGTSFGLGGRIMIDYDAFDGIFYDGGDNDEDSSESEFRRTRLTAKGSVKKDWKYAFTVNIDDKDGSADVNIAYIQYAGFKPLTFTVGKFKEPFSLERLTSSKWISTIERSMLQDALGGSLGAGQPDFAGIAVSGYHEEQNHLNWSVGVFDDGIEDENDDEYGFTGRVALVPHFGEDHFLHLAAAYSMRDFEGSDHSIKTRFGVHTAEKVDLGGSYSLDDADQLGLEAAYVRGPFSLQAEYIDVSMDGDEKTTEINPNATPEIAEDLDFDGYYLQAAYTLTGETRGYKTKGAVFDKIKPKGSYGAWELVGRYENLEVEDEEDQNAEAERWVLGINWYANQNVKFMANYISAEVDDLDVAEDDGDAFSLRAQYVW